MLDRTQQFMVALFHFKLSIPSIIHYLGRNHISSWSSFPELVSCLVSAIPDHNLTDIMHVFQTCCPAKLNAATSWDNFLQHWCYRNHTGVGLHRNQIMRSLAKEDAHQYIIVLRSWLAKLVQNIHMNPLGLVVKPGKDDQLTIEPSNYISVTSTPINLLGDIKNEPPIMFYTMCMLHLIWIYSLRISYPFKYIPGFSEDSARAFQTTKVHPYTVAEFLYTYGPHLCMPTTTIFGSNMSPPKLLAHSGI